MTQRGRAGSRPASHRSRDAAAPRSPAAPRIDLAATRARVRAVIEPVIAAAGFDLEDVTLSRAGRRHVVRVLVDADGGVTLDDVAEVSRDISAALDAAEEAGDEVVAGEYQLEVGSPGVDRPLTLPRHWRRNIGRLVKVGPLVGRVVGVDDAGVMLEVAGEKAGEKVVIAHEDLGPGRVQVEFNRLDSVADEELADFDDGVEDEER